MSSPAPERPVWRTGWLWGVLALLLLFGALGSATFVYGLLGLASGDLLYTAVVAFGAVVAVVALLLMVGILYRVDRYRGVAHRRVELFE